MLAAKNSIFRDKALKHYTEGRKKDVLPNFSSIPAALFGWLLCVLLITTGLFAWYVQVPVSVSGAAMVLGPEGTGQGANNPVVALAFFPPSAAARLLAGQQVQLQTGTGSAPLTSVIVKVEAGTSNPAAALERYGVKTNGAALSSQQVVVALLKINPGIPATDYAGSILPIQANAGTQSLFSAMTGL